MAKNRQQRRRATDQPAGRAPGGRVSAAGAGTRQPAPLVVDPGYGDRWREELARVASEIRELRELERRLVGQAITAGATWTEVAKVLGVSRQTAHQRFRRRIREVQVVDQAAAARKVERAVRIAFSQAGQGGS